MIRQELHLVLALSEGGHAADRCEHGELEDYWATRHIAWL
jgi:hypothetical protein